MSLVIRDRVQETTSVQTSTGSIQLLGTVANFRAFGSVMANGDTTRYCCVDDLASPPAWEIGVGTYNSTSNALARSTVVASSNANAAVSFAGSAGTRVFMTLDAACVAAYVPSIVNALIFG